MSDLRPGDRVADLNPGLAALRAIMRQHTGREPEPNHLGVIDKIDGDMAYVTYDDGLYAPCPLSQLEAHDD